MTANLHAHMVDRHARVYSGRVLPGENAVAMTYELVLTEAPARTAP
jgi:predicted DNA-binding protein with PD1-like motif